MIAITGASGQLGKATLQHLLQRTGAGQLIAVVRNPSVMEPFAAAGVHVRQADYDDPAALRNAFRGAKTVLQISSAAYGADALRQESNVVNAAKAAGIRRIVYTSTLHPGPDRAFQAARTCGANEEVIRQSGMDYTIFRNSMYLETIPLFIGAAMETGHIEYPGGNGRISFAGRNEMAEALAKVLQEDAHAGKTYAITGSEAVSFADIAGMLKNVKGLAGAYTDIPREAYREGLLGYGFGNTEADFYLSMADSIRADEFSATDPALERLLGRKPMTPETFIGLI
ncbi:SDR family oxidoreductase [Chitinophaga lutea]